MHLDQSKLKLMMIFHTTKNAGALQIYKVFREHILNSSEVNEVLSYQTFSVFEWVNEMIKHRKSIMSTNTAFNAHMRFTCLMLCSLIKWSHFKEFFLRFNKKSDLTVKIHLFANNDKIESRFLLLCRDFCPLK